MTAVEAVAAYKDLNEVERGFAHLKGLIDIRPIHHRRDERVRAHVFIAALAFLLDRAMEKMLSQSDCNLSSPLAWRALETIRCITLDLDGQSRMIVTRGSRHASAALKALCITKLDPPAPPKKYQPSCSDQLEIPHEIFQ